jgi:hypothetical protein
MKIEDWPELETMSREELLELVQEVREGLFHCRDCEDFVLSLAENLKVDLSVQPGEEY